MATIKDIAKKAGVSVATVSYVLNNTRYVSPDKKERVLRAIQELNYVPNAVARGLRVRESKMISLIVSDITNPFYPDLAKACEDVAQSYGYIVNMINTNDLPHRTRQAASQVRDGRVDGIIITTALEHDRVIVQELLEQDFPIVMAHRCLPDLQVDTVVSDNIQGAILATNHLIALGHTRIAFMSGVTGSSVSLSRIEGYRAAMETAGLQVIPEWLFSGGAKYEPSYEATKYLMTLPHFKRPTAIINISDIGALGVMDAAHDFGLNVPKDLAIIGFDDLFISATRNIQLTTIRIPRYELGRQATKLLLERINNAQRTGPEQLVLPVELVVRKTCGGSA